MGGQFFPTPEMAKDHNIVYPEYLDADTPDEIVKAIAFSGLYDIHRFLGDHWDEGCYYHCPTAYVPNMEESWVRRLSRVGFVIATGEHDIQCAEICGIGHALMPGRVHIETPEAHAAWIASKSASGAGE